MALITEEPDGPRVVHKLLHPENEDRSRRTPRAVLLHTVVDAEGDTELAPYEDREDISTAVTFYIHSNPGSRLDGQIDQLLDTEVRCVASGVADAWAIAVETEDNSAGHQHDIDALTPEALASYIWLCRKLRQIHPTIPARRCTAATGPGAYGYGYHSQPMRERWGGSSHNPWTKHQGKTCPGDKKVRQYEDHIIPAVTGGPVAPPAPSKEWDEMATKKEIEDVVATRTASLEKKIDTLTADLRTLATGGTFQGHAWPGLIQGITAIRRHLAGDQGDDKKTLRSIVEAISNRVSGA